MTQTLGYWTDNGGYYSCRNPPNQSVLAALAASFNESKIPIRYLQLDPWWFNGESCGDATSFTPKKDLFPGAHRWRKTSFLCHFVLEVKLIISPRQARDKHKETPEKRARERERGMHVFQAQLPSYLRRSACPSSSTPLSGRRRCGSKTPFEPAPFVR